MQYIIMFSSSFILGIAVYIFNIFLLFVSLFNINQACHSSPMSLQTFHISFPVVTEHKASVYGAKLVEKAST